MAFKNKKQQGAVMAKLNKKPPKSGQIYRPIKRNRDEKGHILTYSTVTPSGIKFERNTLREIKIMARDTDAEDKRDAKKTKKVISDSRKLLAELNSKKSKPKLKKRK